MDKNVEQKFKVGDYVIDDDDQRIYQVISKKDHLGDHVGIRIGDLVGSNNYDSIVEYYEERDPTLVLHFPKNPEKYEYSAGIEPSYFKLYYKKIPKTKLSLKLYKNKIEKQDKENIWVKM